MHVPRLRALATAAALAVGTLAAMAGPASAGAVPAKADPAGATRIVISSNTQFGRVLAVGNGPFAGFSAYFITSDFDHHFGCTAVLLHLVIGPIQCTGPASNTNVEWPAVFTKGKPVAGRGVKASLLGEVFRKGLGEQVTYAGHPLYLFDPAPGLVSGQDFNEPGLPPWHGLWSLIHPNGLAAAVPGQLTTTVINGKTVLAALYTTARGPGRFPGVPVLAGHLLGQQVRQGGVRPQVPGRADQRLPRGLGQPVRQGQNSYAVDGPGHTDQLGRPPAVPVQQRDPLRQRRVPSRRQRQRQGSERRDVPPDRRLASPRPVGARRSGGAWPPTLMYAHPANPSFRSVDIYTRTRYLRISRDLPCGALPPVSATGIEPVTLRL